MRCGRIPEASLKLLVRVDVSPDLYEVKAKFSASRNVTYVLGEGITL